jgi:hypothetical protein
MFELFSLKIPLNEIRVPTKMSRAARQEGCGEECRAALRYSSFSPADSYGTRTVRRVVWGNGFRTVLAVNVLVTRRNEKWILFWYTTP